MNDRPLRLFYAVLLLLLALLLESFEMLWGGLSWLAPAWVLVFLIFWLSSDDSPIGIFTAWCFGIIIDVWSGSGLGQNALLFIFIGLFVKSAYNNFHLMDKLNQALVVLMLVFLYKIFNAALSFGPAILLSTDSILYLGTAVSSVVLWLIISLAAGALQKSSASR